MSATRPVGLCNFEKHSAEPVPSAGAGAVLIAGARARRRVLALSAAGSGAAAPGPGWRSYMHKDVKVLLCGAVAGAASRSSVSPLERVKIIMQVQDIMGGGGGTSAPADRARFNSIGQGLRYIYQTEGFMGFYKGNGTNVVRILPYSSTQFLVFDLIKRRYAESGGFDAAQKTMAGSTAGFCSVIVSYPLDFVRGRLSVQGASTATRYTGIANAVARISREEGPLKLYRGMMPSLVGIIPYTGIQFATYHTLRPMVMAYKGVTEDKDLGVLASLGCGGVAGAAAQTAAYPFDLLRRRFQMQGFAAGQLEGYDSIVGAFRHVVRTEGLRGLYKGLAPNYAKVVPTIAVQFAVFEQMKLFVQL